MAWVGKKYKLDRQENFEEYMKAIGKFWDKIFLSIFHLRKFSIKLKKNVRMYNDMMKRGERNKMKKPHVCIKITLLCAKKKNCGQCTPKISNIKAIKPVFLNMPVKSCAVLCLRFAERKTCGIKKKVAWYIFFITIDRVRE